MIWGSRLIGFIDRCYHLTWNSTSERVDRQILLGGRRENIIWEKLVFRHQQRPNEMPEQTFRENLDPMFSSWKRPIIKLELREVEFQRNNLWKRTRRRTSIEAQTLWVSSLVSDNVMDVASASLYTFTNPPTDTVPTYRYILSIM